MTEAEFKELMLGYESVIADRIKHREPLPQINAHTFFEVIRYLENKIQTLENAEVKS